MIPHEEENSLNGMFQQLVTNQHQLRAAHITSYFLFLFLSFLLVVVVLNHGPC
jgi:hypothetical protein